MLLRIAPKSLGLLWIRFIPLTSAVAAMIADNRHRIEMAFPGDPLRDFQAALGQSEGCPPRFGVLHTPRFWADDNLGSGTHEF